MALTDAQCERAVEIERRITKAIAEVPVEDARVIALAMGVCLAKMDALVGCANGEMLHYATEGHSHGGDYWRAVRRYAAGAGITIGEAHEDIDKRVAAGDVGIVERLNRK